MNEKVRVDNGLVETQIQSSIVRISTGVATSVVATSGVGSITLATYGDAGIYKVDIVGGSSAVIALANIADGTKTASGVALPATITVTKDNSATVNVYVEGGALKIQNKTGANISVKVTAIL